ncbi:MAG: hypothetical protein LW635_13135, partial [Microcystis sp. 53598_E5]|nr:hypothetical protein [Microcystis sp. 53598_E5]
KFALSEIAIARRTKNRAIHSLLWKIGLLLSRYLTNQIKAMANKNDRFIQCDRCQMEIDLASQEVKEVKGCNWCGSREFLLDLTSHQASFMYSINPETNGKRLRKGDYHADEPQAIPV